MLSVFCFLRGAKVLLNRNYAKGGGKELGVGGVLPLRAQGH